MKSIRLNSKEQEEIVLKNQGLVYYYANQLNIPYSEYEDMISIGTIGLIKAAATFDESKKSQFATYATRCIKNEFFMYFRKQKGHANDISLNDPICNDEDGNELTWRDIIPSPDNFVEEIEKREFFINFISIVLNLLKPEERLIMLYEIAGMNQRSIAKNVNISQSYISRLEKKLNNKVKSYFNSKKQIKEVFSMAIVGDFYQISFSSEDIKNFSKIFATLLQNLTSTEDLPDFKVNCNKKRIMIQIPAHPESFSFIAKIVQEIDNYSIKFESNKNRDLLDKKSSQKMKVEQTSKNENDKMKKGKKSASKEKNVITNSEEEQKETVKTQEVEEQKETVKTQEVEKQKETVKTQEVEEQKENVEIQNAKEPKENIENSNVSKKVIDSTEAKTKKGISKAKQVREYMLSRDTFSIRELKQKFPNLAAGDITITVYNAKTKGLITPITRGVYKVIKN